MSPIAAWAFIIIGFILPLVHVLMTPGLSKKDIEQASGGSCPFSPRAGWVVIVLVLGPIGWLMFMNSRRKKARMAGQQVQPPPPPPGT